METSTIETTALSTGLATAIFNQGIGLCRESRKDKTETEREARYLAIRLAVVLENFAIECAEVIADQDLQSSSDGFAGKSHGVLPDLVTYPEGDWRVLKSDLLGRCLTLRNELKLSDSQIGFWEDVGERECIPRECAQQAGKCGYRAWLLANDLRSRYDLGNFDPKYTSWDVVKTLKDEHDVAFKQIQERNNRP